jgi:hypothetical protein
MRTPTREITMNFRKICLNNAALSILLMSVSLNTYAQIPAELTKETKNNDEAIESILSMKNGEACLKSLYKTLLFNEIKAEGWGFSLSYTTETSDYQEYNKTKLRSIEIYVGNSVYSKRCL